MSLKEIRDRWEGIGPWAWMRAAGRDHARIMGRDNREPVATMASPDHADRIAAAPSDIAYLLAEADFLRSLLRDHGIDVPERKP